MTDSPRSGRPPSFWFTQVPPVTPRPPLPGDGRADVVIVGAGYTGLWTAFYLKRARPDLDVRIVERHFAGYGASGRNGGWLSGGMAWNPDRYAATHGAGATRAFIAALRATVPEVVGQARAHAIDADIHETDELTVATNPAQLDRLRAEVAARRNWGEDIRLLDRAATRARVDIPGALGASVLPGVARIQPAKLVTGLAQVVEGLGVLIHEGTTVTAIAPGRVETNHGTLSAPIVLRCTEGFTATLPGQRRTWLPLNSAQIVTAPLPQAVWDRIGWQGAELLGSADHLYAYCQRTACGRIAVGGRGLPYLYGSRIDRGGVTDAVTVARLMAMLRRLFPAAADLPIEFEWCGTLAAPRDWCATVGLDRATGLGWAGGYVGVGVATSNLAGRTLADLALGRESDLTALPWVNRTPRRWEPEPLRWLGVRGMYRLYALADRVEARTGRRSGLAALGDRLTGR
jgi:glycine/D-amino acid oxidase-like deaminating enzyme